MFLKVEHTLLLLQTAADVQVHAVKQFMFLQGQIVRSVVTPRFAEDKALHLAHLLEVVTLISGIPEQHRDQLL